MDIWDHLREINVDIAGFPIKLLSNFVNASKEIKKPLKLLLLFVSLTFAVVISWGHEIKGLDSVHICDLVTVAFCFIIPCT